LVLFKIFVPALTLKEIERLIQLNLSAIALAGVATWKRVKPVVIRDAVLLPAAGFDCTGAGFLFKLFWVTGCL
jgi:hypothetical protein